MLPFRKAINASFLEDWATVQRTIISKVQWGVNADLKWLVVLQERGGFGQCLYFDLKPALNSFHWFLLASHSPHRQANMEFFFYFSRLSFFCMLSASNAPTWISGVRTAHSLFSLPVSEWSGRWTTWEGPRSRNPLKWNSFPVVGCW